MKATISSKGKLVFPAALLKQDKIHPGQQFEVERMQAGEYLLRRVPAGGSLGLVDWLQACPEKDWFAAITSATTDEL
jgi:bifunctional DNA-binding transcriptional regulator/antitoxin component of YhaV-PrlF toxin-antitoxin module